MANILPEFNICLKQKGVQPIHPQPYDLDRINAFLEEAYLLNDRITDLTRSLHAIRPAYLSAAQPTRRKQTTQVLTDAQRESFDAESKGLIIQLNDAISGLKQAEDVRNQTADAVALSRRSKGGIGRWAAGGGVTALTPEEEMRDAERRTVKAVRESVVLFLQGRLEAAGRIQSEMMDVRLSRDIERSKSILAKSKVPSSSGTSFNPATTSTDDEPTNLTQEQLTVFAEENHELLKHYENQMDQVRTAEKSILEISELHSTLHANLQQQSEQIDQLVGDQFLVTENLGKGNRELKRASERRSTAQALFYGTVAFCSFLVVWDVIF